MMQFLVGKARRYYKGALLIVCLLYNQRTHTARPAWPVWPAWSAWPASRDEFELENSSSSEPEL